MTFQEEYRQLTSEVVRGMLSVQFGVDPARISERAIDVKRIQLIQQRIKKTPENKASSWLLDAFKREQRLMRDGCETTHWSNHDAAYLWMGNKQRRIRNASARVQKPKDGRYDCARCLARLGFGFKAIRKIVGIHLHKTIKKWKRDGLVTPHAVINYRHGLTKPRYAPEPEWLNGWGITAKEVRLYLLPAIKKEKREAQRSDSLWNCHPIAVCWFEKARYHRNKRRIYSLKMASPQQKLKLRIRTRVYRVLKGSLKSAPTLQMIGCSIDFLKAHIESKFTKRMSWANYGPYWHLDHVVPCAEFDLTKPEEQRRCFHFSNLQPLEAKKNWSKHARFNTSSNGAWPKP